MAYTKFIADLPCSNCGQTNRAWILSRLDEQGESYQVGDRVDDRITIRDFDVAGLTVRRPSEGEPIHAVMSFTCTNCNASNFAEVVFADGKVEAIAAIELDPETLARTHYLNGDDTEEMLAAIAGQPLMVGSKIVPNWLDLVRAGLDAGRRW